MESTKIEDTKLFDCSSFIENVYAVAKAKKIPISQLEQKSQLCIGTLSRARKHGKWYISLLAAFNMCQILGVSIDVMCKRQIKYVDKQIIDAHLEFENGEEVRM